jgi:hypothetical protein
MKIENVENIPRPPRYYVHVYSVIDEYGPCPDFIILGEQVFHLTQETVLQMARLVREELPTKQWPIYSGLHGSKTSYYQFGWEGKVLVLKVITYVVPTLCNDEGDDW